MDDKNPSNLFDEEAFGLRVAVIPAGDFINEDGIKIEYENRIKIALGKLSIKLTALQALGLLNMLQSVEFKESITEWAQTEKAEREAELRGLDL